jgi:hypothetical protein
MPPAEGSMFLNPFPFGTRSFHRPLKIATVSLMVCEET